MSDSYKYETPRHVLLVLGWYYPEIHRGVTRFARDHNWHVTADFDDPVPEHWAGDGIITLLGAQDGLWDQLQRFRVPVVDLTESHPEIELPRVTIDNVRVGVLAAEHFLERGYRNFAFYQRWDLGVSRQRRASWQDRLAAEGYESENLGWQQEQAGRPDTRAERHRWLMERMSRLEKPFALFAARDVDAVEAIEACLAAGISIPESVGVLGVDNTETICDCLQVSLSSVICNWERVGWEGAARLHSLMQGGIEEPTVHYIPPTGVATRQSSDGLAVPHREVATALRFIRMNYREPICMNDILDQVPMSRSGLEKAFREHYLRPPMEEVRRLRLVEAQRLLRETDEKILVVARRAGFNTSHNLCRTFQQLLGTSPAAYRRDQQRETEGR
ncbi:MAG: XylR family transcriptional regulator [Rubinisphaera brasiliensis]|uniref:XylR family transcriptional regulator n=1 Tax=Rubinisphaera brasiliensis TaxID=119 RepID=UPI00391C5AB8